MIPTKTASSSQRKVGCASLVLAISLATGDAYACAFAKAQYRNVKDSSATLKTGYAADGETIFLFQTKRGNKDVSLTGALDTGASVMRLNAKGRKVKFSQKVAPTIYVLNGFTASYGIGDGRWQLYRCAK